MATLQSADSLAKLYGNINYNDAAIEAAFNTATQAKLAERRAADRRTFNNQLTGLGRTQNMLTDTLRKNNAAYLQSGANAGMAGANNILAMLGMQQQSSDGLTQLTQQTRANEYAGLSELAQNKRDTMQYADTQKAAMMSSGVGMYNTERTAEAQEEAARQARAAQEEAARQARAAQEAYAKAYLEAAKAAADAQKYGSNQQFNSSAYAANAAYSSAQPAAAQAAAQAVAKAPVVAAKAPTPVTTAKKVTAPVVAAKAPTPVTTAKKVTAPVAAKKVAGSSGRATH